MFFSDFEGNSISLDNAQTAVAVTLLNLEELNAGNAVLLYATTGSRNDSRLGSIIKTREELIENCNAINAYDTVFALISYLAQNDILLVETANSYTTQLNKVNLNQLLVSHNVNQVYAETMKMLIRSVNMGGLLEIFMLTTESKAKLKRTIFTNTAMSANGIQFNKILDSDLDFILDKFILFVKQYCAERYDPSSGTPIAYLRNAFNSFFFRSTNKLQCFDHINNVGVDRNVGADDFTILDFYGVPDGTAKSDELPFLQIVSDIQTLSGEFFRHRDSSGINYDIVSYYKAKVLTRDMQKYSGNNYNHSFILEFSDSMCDNIEGNGPTIAQKFRGRSKILDSMEELLTGPITPGRLLAKYNDVIRINGTLSTKNNIQFFGKTSGSGLSDSEKFEMLAKGYLALRKLIEYLDSPANTTGVTIRTLPTHIFRDTNLNTNFRDINTYIKNIDDVLKLQQEVSDMTEDAYGSEAGKLLNSFAVRNRVLTKIEYDKKEVLAKILRVPLCTAQSLIARKGAASSTYEMLKELQDFPQRNAVINGNAKLYSLDEWLSASVLDVLDEITKLVGTFCGYPKYSYVEDLDYLMKVRANLRQMISGGHPLEIDLTKCCSLLNFIQLFEVLLYQAEIDVYEYDVRVDTGTPIRTGIFEQKMSLEDLVQEIVCDAFQKYLESQNFTEEQINELAEQSIDVLLGYIEIIYGVWVCVGTVCFDLMPMEEVEKIRKANGETVPERTPEEIARDTTQLLVKASSAYDYLKKVVQACLEVLNLANPTTKDLYVSNLKLAGHVKFLSLRNPTTSIQDLNTFGDKVIMPSIVTGEGRQKLDSALIGDTLKVSLNVVNTLLIKPQGALFAVFNSLASVISSTEPEEKYALLNYNDSKLLQEKSLTANHLALESRESDGAKLVDEFILNAIFMNYDIDLNGYCMSKGEYVVKPAGIKDAVYYMHSTGYWISISELVTNNFVPVKQEEVTSYVR